MTDTISLAFSQDDCERAFVDWGCNCGPAALAAVLGLHLRDVRAACESAGFATRRYMSPTMMKTALAELGVKWHARKIGGIVDVIDMPRRGLVRVQWEGPWTQPGANPKWAYRHTHWVACWRQQAFTAAGAVLAILDPVIFDVNGGLMQLERWEEEIVPLITASIPRADGVWSVTHSWEVE